MYFILPFIFLLFVLLKTRNNIYAMLTAIATAIIIYSFEKKVSIILFITEILPNLLLHIMGPSGYLYPLIFLIGVAILIDLFKNLYILDTYNILLNKIFKNSSQKFIQFGIIFSPIFFFIDDYLIMFGIKNFFGPLLKNNEETKKELTFYSEGLAPSAVVLLFFSTWSGIILTSIKSLLEVTPHLQQYKAVNIFFESKKYYVYPIIIFFGTLFYTIFGKHNKLEIRHCNDKRKINHIDITLFLLFPLSIITNFLYKLYYLKLFLYELDVALIMCEGLLIAFIIICILLFCFKSIPLLYILKSAKKTVVDYQKTVFSLLLCWMFSKIMELLLHNNIYFFLPSSCQYLYPLFYFISSLIISLLLGSEWGSISIMIPLLSCITNYSILLISLGGIISGVIAGCQLSPISNTNITVSAIFECDSLLSYTYRLSWTIPLIIITLIAFIFIPFIIL